MTDVDVADQKVPGRTNVHCCKSLSTAERTQATSTGWTFVDTCTSGTYKWIGGANQDWQVPTNWTPTRATPNVADVLVFDGATTPSPIVNNVPTETDAEVDLGNGALVTLNASSIGAPQTLTLSGGASQDRLNPGGYLRRWPAVLRMQISLSSNIDRGHRRATFIIQGAAHGLTGRGAARSPSELDRSSPRRQVSRAIRSVRLRNGSVTFNKWLDGFIQCRRRSVWRRRTRSGRL